VGPGFGGFAVNTGSINAANHLKIKKNQDTGDSTTCQSCSPKYNIETIEVGNRVAQAIGAGVFGPGAFRGAGNFGGVSATNDVEIVTNQQ